MLTSKINVSRCSDLHALDIEMMRFGKSGVMFSLAELTKISKLGMFAGSYVKEDNRIGCSRGQAK